MKLILSIFPGIDLLGRGFEAEGFCVVRGPDLIWGGDIRKFHVPPGRFDGLIGGSPCPDFSSLRRVEPSGNGLEMLGEFKRIAEEGQFPWWLLENVPRVPSIDPFGGYELIQRIDVDGRECGCRQRRLRHFQFGSLINRPLAVTRHRLRNAVTDQAAATATEGRRAGRRDWPAFCALQGFEPLEFPGLSVVAKYAAVGNGVPFQMGRMLARSINDWIESRGLGPMGVPVTLCACGCGRPVEGKRTYALPCCRKRMQRLRDYAAAATSREITRDGPFPVNSREVTSAVESQLFGDRARSCHAGGVTVNAEGATLHAVAERKRRGGAIYLREDRCG